MRLNPEATFDCLYVAHRLQAQNGSFATHELQLFPYLGCLLWLYQRKAVADWGYAFVGTELGAPFSQDVDSAWEALIQRGYISTGLAEGDGGRFVLTSMAEQRLEQLSQLVGYKDRTACLKAACASIEAFSIGMVSNALSHEPELRRAHSLPASRRLLESAMQSQIYLQFEAIRSALSRPSADLRLPTVVWLTALYESSNADIAEA